MENRMTEWGGVYSQCKHGWGEVEEKSEQDRVDRPWRSEWSIL